MQKCLDSALTPSDATRRKPRWSLQLETYGTASSELVQASEVDSIKEKEEDGYVVEEILGAFIDEAAIEPAAIMFSLNWRNANRAGVLWK